MNVIAQTVIAEPGQRYWRRRANRRVRKARLTRSLRRWSVFAMALTIIGAALFQAGSHAVERIKEQGGFSVAVIDIEGAERGGTESIRGRLAPYLDRNIVDVNLYEVARVAGGDPWVLEASVKRVLPRTLIVTVTEREPAAVAIIDELDYVVDTTGYVVGRLQPGPLERLPVLKGLDGLSDEELTAALSAGVRTIARLRRTAGVWVGQLAALDFSRRDRIAVSTVDPGPTILLDPERVDRNLNHYLELRREIARRTGPSLQYVDLRWQDRIAVMPAVRTSLTEGG